MFILLFLFTFLASSPSSSQDQDTVFWVSFTQLCSRSSSYSWSHWSFGPARTIVFYTSVHLVMNFFFLYSSLCQNCCWELILLVPPCEFQTWLQFTFMRSHKPDNRLGPLGIDCAFWAMMWQSFGCHYVRASGEVTHMEMCRHLSSCGKEFLRLKFPIGAGWWPQFYGKPPRCSS